MRKHETPQIHKISIQINEIETNTLKKVKSGAINNDAEATGISHIHSGQIRKYWHPSIL